VIHRVRVTLARGFLKPSESFLFVLLYDLARQVNDTQIFLRFGISIFGRASIPLECFLIILLNAVSTLVDACQIQLRIAVAALSFIVKARKFLCAELRLGLRLSENEAQNDKMKEHLRSRIRGMLLLCN